MAEKLIIHGNHPLKGEIKLSGAKNSATKLMVASLLTNESCTIENWPDLGDTQLTRELIQSIGAQTSYLNGNLNLSTPEIKNFKVKELSRRNRIPILAIAPLLLRCGKAEIPLLGGDLIGPRPVNFHIEALEKMGAKIEQRTSSYYAQAESLKGTNITLPYPSVGTTETVLLASVLAKGKTVLENAAIEPEIFDLVNFLKKMGARIENRDRVFEITGVEKLYGIKHAVMPDRNEAVSFASLAIATKGNIFIRGAQAQDLTAFLDALNSIGAQYYEEKGEGMRFTHGSLPLRPIQLETDVHPGFMTDWQPPFAVILTHAHGTSTIHETVYEDRFGYTKILKDMGAHIDTSSACLGKLKCRFAFRGNPHSAIIQGPRELIGKNFTVSDIRAGVSTVVAALAAQGSSTISGIEHIERGYERFFEKIKSLGAKIELK